ncbi:MAG: helix-turn-helix domain-containing GNAT family N-acetyltransferase [Actinomycetota bacterium]|nr:helix-turn-helix domain-containing GNAT family N-acetyltransferase [Actinomycetota bacterium]
MATAEQITAVRAFNRFYTSVAGLLREGLLGTDLTLTEARLVYDLAQRERTEVADLRETLGLDAGYLSRLIARLERRGLLTRARSDADARRQVLALTPAGRRKFELLDRRSAEEVGALLDGVPPGERSRLVGAMDAIRAVLDPGSPSPAFVLRPPAPGDYGWIVQRHGAVYSEEHGFDVRFEALAARIVSDFAAGHDPRREAAWIADVDGQPAGSVLCVRKSARVAQLRLLFVDPRARGMGIGTRLVDECLRFARAAGYRRMTLWTNDVLAEARRIYDRAGFEQVDEEPHEMFGPRVLGQRMTLDL